MLVDLEWTLKYAAEREHVEWIKKFDTENGHLQMTVEFPPEIEKRPQSRIWHRTVAERVGKGVYWANNLWNDVETYTEWRVVHPWNESKKIFDAMCEAHKRGDTKEHERLRDEFRRIKEEYGNADELRQVFKYGHRFIQSPDPYVLEIHTADVSGPEGDRYLSKNGSYIGKKKMKDLKEVLHFSFHKLERKDHD